VQKIFGLMFALGAVMALGDNSARGEAWQPSPGHTQATIWPGAIPDAHPVPGAELVTTREELVADRSWLYIERVSIPTMTVYSPVGSNNGVAVVVFPGGGYKGLAIDLEGTEACDWLTAKGITCVLLKYRVPFSGDYWDAACHCQRHPKALMALEDVQRTVGLVRFHAAEWKIDPSKIGVMGFSAGGHLVAMISTHFSKRLYPPVDAADKESCRPDFAVAVYPGHMALAENSIALNPNVGAQITQRTPPTFLLQNENDNVDMVEDSLSYYVGLKKAGVPVEMHLYAEGGHAFGLRRTKFPVTAWPQLVETWLMTIKMISEPVR
jgi:acetyl esterase/lipase